MYCNGDRVFYTEEQAGRYGLENHSGRCRSCPVSRQCNFHLDMADYPDMKNLYLKCEQYDGYHRDKCIFSDEIDIEDSMNVVVRYRKGAILSYSLNAFSGWEGYHIAFNGTRGRLEQRCQESSYVSADSKVQGEFQAEHSKIQVYPHFKTSYRVPVRHGRGGHGGADIVLLNDIFGEPEPDRLLRAADYVQGAYSVLVGAAANKSIETKNVVQISDLVTGLSEPNYPGMSGGHENIRYVKKFKRIIEGREVPANIPLSISAPQ